MIVFRAEAVQGAVVAPHAAIRAILAAKIGNLDHGADKDPLSEVSESRICGVGVQRFLGFAP